MTLEKTAAVPSGRASGMLKSLQNLPEINVRRSRALIWGSSFDNSAVPEARQEAPQHFYLNLIPLNFPDSLQAKLYDRTVAAAAGRCLAGGSP